MADAGTVTLHQFPRFFGLANASPFCVKVEAYLRMAGIAYELDELTNPARMPKGKIPAISHAGRTIGDSTFIVEYLEATFRPGLDDRLDAAERAVAHAFSRMLEERSYWVMVYSRWVDDAGWAQTRRMFFGAMAPGLRYVVGVLARRKIQGQLRGHGIGLHSRDEIYALGAADVRALSDFLGDKPFFMGDEPTGVDAGVYGFVANALHTTDSPLADAARGHANLAGYCERMRERYFPELEAKGGGAA